jgi:hypothetical protein
MSDFNPSRLSNEEYRQVIGAALQHQRINVGGQTFDGTLDHDPKELARLAERVQAPDARTQALAGQLNRPDLNIGAIERLSTAASRLSPSDLTWVLPAEQRLVCELSPTAQQAQSCLPAASARASAPRR